MKRLRFHQGGRLEIQCPRLSHSFWCCLAVRTLQMGRQQWMRRCALEESLRDLMMDSDLQNDTFTITNTKGERKEAMSVSGHVYEEVVIVVCIHDPHKAH
ncbi:hypothetical protein CY35_05G069100 [Sphagnum magellanicum]|nr:hypothetical protein CY35_05G069100 [Sphagnum magellanicum]